MAAKSKTVTKSPASKATSTVARSDDGTVQITFTVPLADIKAVQAKALDELGKSVEVAGFRKGKAPKEKIQDSVEESVLVEKTLSLVLPKLLNDAITKAKLKPAIYPKFQLISATMEKDWQIRATTCELPKFELGDYKQSLLLHRKKAAIWTPDKGKPDMSADKSKEQTKAEKEQEILKLLLKAIKIDIPKLLLDEEINQRLSALLARIEKLGLTLDSYLASIGKTPQTLRDDYQKQAIEAISLNLILNRIAEEENIKVSESQLKEAINSTPQGQKPPTDEQKRLIESILRRSAVLDSLASLL